MRIWIGLTVIPLQLHSRALVGTRKRRVQCTAAFSAPQRSRKSRGGSIAQSVPLLRAQHVKRRHAIGDRDIPDFSLAGRLVVAQQTAKLVKVFDVGAAQAEATSDGGKVRTAED